MRFKTYLIASLSTIVFGGLFTAVPAFAQATNSSPSDQNDPGWSRGMMDQNAPQNMTKPAAVGKVTAINGTSLTVSGMNREPMNGQNPSTSASSNTTPTTITYTVDASNAVVKKDNATSTLSVIAVGDNVVVEGTTSGTNITATMIRDGMPKMGNKDDNGRRGNSTSTPLASPITGNGQPVIAGTISAINGSSLTISTKSNTSYSVDISNAKIVKGSETISASSLAVSDEVVIQGSVNGTSVTASSVIDNTKPTTSNSGNDQPGEHHGFFDGVGSFFRHLFGF